MATTPNRPAQRSSSQKKRTSFNVPLRRGEVRHHFRIFSILKLKVADISTLLGIDLTTTVAKLDATASDVVAQQRDALIQRKDLAQKTKDFRKLDDASKLAEYKGLLKCWSCLRGDQIDLSS